MRVLIAGIDGYLGWSLAQYLADRGHEVAGIDRFLRRQWVGEMGSCSATPIASMEDRLQGFADRFGDRPLFQEGDLREYEVAERMFQEFMPDAVVQFAECPSAPYSMIDRNHTVFVQMNNLLTTFHLMFAIRDLNPECHLLKLGTMGEYGTPNIDIAEGFFEVEFRGRKDRVPYPRQAGSWYHWSKVHGSNNIMFASKIWGLRATDIMQGVVFGTRINGRVEDPRLMTRLDFDQAFGTAINRFCCQAIIGHPLTPYGAGGQRRSFLPLRDSMQCLTLALENPPTTGEYRVFNQFEQVHGIADLAEVVARVAEKLGLKPTIQHLENPRGAVELQDHYYNPDHQHLLDLGYVPTNDLEGEIEAMLTDLMPHRDRIDANRDALIPDVRWDAKREKVRALSARP